MAHREVIVYTSEEPFSSKSDHQQLTQSGDRALNSDRPLITSLPDGPLAICFMSHDITDGVKR